MRLMPSRRLVRLECFGLWRSSGAPRGVTINAISLTVADTEMSAAFWSGEKGDRARAEIPLRRFARPREIDYAAMFLASYAAAMIPSANLVIDGGFTIW